MFELAIWFAAIREEFAEFLRLKCSDFGW